jgi:hypothetical protein
MLIESQVRLASFFFKLDGNNKIWFCFATCVHKRGELAPPCEISIKVNNVENFASLSERAPMRILKDIKCLRCNINSKKEDFFEVYYEKIL